MADPDGVAEKSVPAAKLLSEIAYERILEGLFDKKVPAGAFVSQSELVKLLDIPVAPLRDALHVLEAEGVLTIHPRSGIQFIKPDLELTRSTYQFRSIIERAAVRVYAEMGDEAEVARILDRHNALIDVIARDGLTPEAQAEMEAMERMLHGAVIDILKNPLIASSYRRMANYLRLLRLERKITAPLALRTLREHVDILAACRRRDPDAAEAALNRHFQAALQRNLGFF
ncbi:Transcriptional regulator, GntR family [Mesorhizobium sp. ORS 3324]|nr:Transcriptional regulator, GntR family [Mesorhizobium sp. ORS 3324]